MKVTGEFSSGEVVPAEPPPADQHQHPAELRPHQVAEPLPDRGDPRAGAPGQDFQHDHGRDHHGETDDGDGTGGDRVHAYRLTKAQPASSHARTTALLIRCGPMSGSIRLVNDGCHGQELSRQADASHSKNAARQITQYDIPVMSSSSGGGIRSGGRTSAMVPRAAAGNSTPIRAPRLNGVVPATTQAYTASPAPSNASNARCAGLRRVSGGGQRPGWSR